MSVSTEQPGYFLRNSFPQVNHSDLCLSGCIDVFPATTLAPAAPVRGPAGAEEAALLGKGFIFKAVKDVLFPLLRSTTISRMFQHPPPHPHGNAISSRAWVLTPAPHSTLPMRVLWRCRQELHAFGTTWAVSFDGKSHGVLQHWPVWQAVGFASHPQPFYTWLHDWSLVPHEPLFEGWGFLNTDPGHAAFVWFICAFYTTYRIHICNVTVALPSPDDNISANITASLMPKHKHHKTVITLLEP